jgi:hypothetical protein
VDASVARHTPDARDVRCLWLGSVVELHKAVLVVWFTLKTDSPSDPAVKAEVAQLQQLLSPGLQRNRRIDVLVLNAWIQSGAAWRRRWRASCCGAIPCRPRAGATSGMATRIVGSPMR